MRSAVKMLIGKAGQLPPIMQVTCRKLAETTNIIYYHYFGDPKCFSDEYEDCSVAKFEADLLLIKRHFEFVPLADLLKADEFATNPIRPRIALTFDDGFDMFRNGIVDVLAGHGI